MWRRVCASFGVMVVLGIMAVIVGRFMPIILVLKGPPFRKSVAPCVEFVVVGMGSICGGRRRVRRERSAAFAVALIG